MYKLFLLPILKENPAVIELHQILVQIPNPNPADIQDENQEAPVEAAESNQETVKDEETPAEVCNSNSKVIEKNAFKCETTLQNYTCKHCNFRTELRIILNNHTQFYHNNHKNSNYKLKVYNCKLCDFTSHSLLVWHQHQWRCTFDIFKKENKCHYCSHRFYQRDHLKEHMLLIHKLDTTSIKHKRRTKRKTAIASKEDLIKLHKSSELYECDYCNITTSRKHNLQEHIRNHHLNRIVYCRLCGFTTRDSDELLEHSEGHRNKETGAKKYKCYFCFFKTAYKKSLAKHIAMIHNFR